jgi:hypothetical protein
MTYIAAFKICGAKGINCMMLKKIGIVLFSAILAGCASTPLPYTELSEGAKLLIDTRIQSEYEIKEILKAVQANKEKAEYQKESVLPANAAIDVVFGSGLVSSAAVLSDTGMWVSPSHFMDWSQLGLATLSFLISTDMKRHPLTYTYFFNVDPNCDELECTENAIAAFFQDMSDEYIKSAFNKGHNGAPIEKVEIAKSNFAINRVTLFYNYAEPAGERDLDWRVMSVARLDEVNEDKFIWGNEEPRGMPDDIGFLDLPYIDESNMLIEVSKRHPTILIYRGIADHFAKEGKPCYGGFFIKQGKPIVVDELNCVKYVE